MKTTLKTAKFTLKTAFARCVAANAVVVSCISVAKVAKWWCDCGMFCRGSAVSMCYSDDCDVYLRQKCGVKTAKYCAETVKIWCEDGKIVVYLRRVHA